MLENGIGGVVFGKHIEDIVYTGILPYRFGHTGSEARRTKRYGLTVKESIRVASDISGEPRIMLPSLYCTVFGTLTAMFYCRMVEMRPVRSMGAVKKGALRSYLIGIAVGIVLMSAITLLSVLFGVNSIAVRSGINFGMIALYFGGFLVQGMSEEFIFRGYLMNSVGGKHSAALAVGISALAFRAYTRQMRLPLR